MNQAVSESSSGHAPRSHVNRNRGSFWATSAIAIIGVVVFTVLVIAAVRLLDLRLAGSAMLAAMVILAIVPALLWMSAFYMLDRDEPEPRGYVLGIFALGGLSALALGIPVIRQLFVTQEWLGRTPWYTQLLGSIVIVGMVQEFCKYAVVRYTVFFSDEFDERIDGIIYGAAAGLGFGTIMAIQHLLSAGGAQLDMAVMRIAVITLAQASFGGLTGYFIGRAKFDDMGPWWLPAGLSTSAVFNGAVTWLLGEVSTQGLAVTPHYGLVMAAVVAAGMFGFLAWQTRRLASTARTRESVSSVGTFKRSSSMQATKTRETGWFWAGQEPEYLVIMTLLVSLLIGGLLMYASIGRTETLRHKELSIRYPAQWMATAEASAGEAGAQDMETRAGVRLSILYELNPRDPVTMDDLVTRRAFTLGQNRQLFRVLETKTTQIRGQSAVLLSYAYVAEPALSSYQSALPRVVQGAEYLIPYNGVVYLVAFEGDANAWQEGNIERMLASIRFH